MRTPPKPIFPSFPDGLANEDFKKELRRRMILLVELGFLPKPVCRIDEVRG